MGGAAARERRAAGRGAQRGAAVLAALVCAAAALALPPASPAAAADVVDCRRSVGPLRTITSARNMTCAQAARDLARYRGFTKRRFRTPGGFRCVQVSGIDIAGQWRCTRGARAYRFDFVD
jgi:hypothetical protein